MKNKTTFPIIGSLLRYGFAFVLFLVMFSYAKPAYALCNYKINRFDTGTQTTATSDDTLTFYGEVQFTQEANQTSEITDCTQNYSNIYVVTPTLQVPGAGGEVQIYNKRSLSASNFTRDGVVFFYSFTQTFNLKTYASQLQGKSSIVFNLGAAGTLKGVPAKSTWTVNLQGSGTSFSPIPAGEKRIIVTFTPVKQLYVKGDTVTLSAGMQASDVRSLPNAVTKLRMETLVNGTKRGEYQFNKDDLLSIPKQQALGNVDVPLFQNGQNNIVVNFYDVGSGVKIGSSGNVVLSASGIISAPKTDPNGGGGGTPPKTDPNGGGVTANCTGPNPDPKYCLYNPLPTGELTNMFLWIARGFLAIVAIWSVIFIIYGGFRMVMAAGDEEAYTQAKTTITWAILGLVVAALSFSIVAIVRNFLGADIKGTLNF